MSTYLYHRVGIGGFLKFVTKIAQKQMDGETWKDNVECVFSYCLDIHNPQS